MTTLRELIAEFVVGADTTALDTADKKLDASKKRAVVLGGTFGKLRGSIELWTRKADEQAGALVKKTGVIGELVKRAGAAFGALAVIGSGRSFVQEFAAEARELTTISNRLRVNTDELQVLGTVGRSVGLDLNGTAGVLGTLRERLDAAVRTGENAYTFRRLGVVFRNTDRTARPLFQVFGDLATGLARVTRESRRLRLTDQMLGSEGRRFLELFGDGRDAIQDFQAAMQASGGGLSRNAIRAGLEYSQAWNLAGLSIDTLRSKLALALLPKLAETVRYLNRGVIWINRTTLVTNTLKAAFGFLAAYMVRQAAVMVAANLPLVLQWAVIAAGVGVVVVVVDDLLTLFRGGKSLVGGFIDELFGVGTAQQVVTDLKDSFHEFMEFVTKTKDAVVELWDSFHLGGGATTATSRLQSRAPARLLQGDPRNDSELARRIRANLERQRISGGAVLPAPVNRPGAFAAPGIPTIPFPRSSAQQGPRINFGDTNVSIGNVQGAPTAQTRREMQQTIDASIQRANAQRIRQLQESGLIQVLPDGE